MNLDQALAEFDPLTKDASIDQVTPTSQESVAEPEANQDGVEATEQTKTEPAKQTEPAKEPEKAVAAPEKPTLAELAARKKAQEQARRQAKEQATQQAQPSVDPVALKEQIRQELMAEITGIIRKQPEALFKQAGVDPMEATRALVTAQLGDKAPEDLRIDPYQYKTNAVVGSLQSQVEQLKEQLQAYQAQQTQQAQVAQFRATLEDYSRDIDPGKHPHLAHLYAVNKAALLNELYDHAVYAANNVEDGHLLEVDDIAEDLERTIAERMNSWGFVPKKVESSSPKAEKRVLTNDLGAQAVPTGDIDIDSPEWFAQVAKDLRK